MGIIAKRLLSYTFAVIAWLVAGVSLALDLIGWSTAPEDTSVAMGRVMQILSWLASLPSWIPYGSATALTMWLIFVSWPKAQVAQAALTPKPKPPPDISDEKPVKLLSTIHYDVSKARTKVGQEIVDFPGSRSLDLMVNGRQNVLSIETAAHVRSACGLLSSFGIPTPHLGSTIERRDALMMEDYFSLALPFVGQSQVDELKNEAARFIQERQKPSQ